MATSPSSFWIWDGDGEDHAHPLLKKRKAMIMTTFTPSSADKPRSWSSCCSSTASSVATFWTKFKVFVTFSAIFSGLAASPSSHPSSRRKEGRRLWSLLLSSWEVEVSSAIPGCEWERNDYGPWPPSSRRKEGKWPWSLPLTS